MQNDLKDHLVGQMNQKADAVRRANEEKRANAPPPTKKKLITPKKA